MSVRGLPATILDLCGGTGSWSRPYRDAGYDVVLVTLPENDVRIYVPPRRVHGVLAAPPCTDLSSSGARWFAAKGPAALTEALAVADACLRIITICQPEWWALENPVGRLARYYGPPVVWFQPWQYGDPYTKKTGLWGRFTVPRASVAVPPDDIDKKHDSPVHNSPRRKMSYIHDLPTEADRAMLRAYTPPGFARAFFEANP